MSLSLRSYHLGVDLGQRKDHSALVVVEQRIEQTAKRDPVTYEFEFVRRLVVVKVEQVRLGTQYAAVLDRIEKLSHAAELRDGNVTVTLDATGLGGPVTEFLRKRSYRGELYPVVITGGQEGRYDDGFWPTPKGELITGLLRAFEVEGLCVGRDVAGWDLLAEELMGMRRETSSRGPKFVSAGAHDDLVMALALALFGVRQRMLPTHGAGVRRRRG